MEVQFPKVEIEPIATLKRVGTAVLHFATQHISEANRGGSPMLDEHLEDQLTLDFDGTN